MTAQVNIKLEPELKREVDLISSELGLNTSDVIRVFLKKFVSAKGFPFPLISDYNEETKKAMKDVRLGKNIVEVDGELNSLKKH